MSVKKLNRAEETQKILDSLEERRPVWDEMQMLFMDTEADLDLIARVCAKSSYSLEELREILFLEVFPALRFNLLAHPGGEWRGFKMDYVEERILEKHTRGRFFQPLILRNYVKKTWAELSSLIDEKRCVKSSTRP